VNTAFLFIICSLVWGTTWIAITFQLGDVAPAASVSFRFTLAAFFIFLIAKYKYVSLSASRVSHAWFALLGLFYTLNYVAVYMAEIEISSGLVAVAGSCIMFFNILFSRIFFGHQITPTLGIGALLGLSGVCCLFYVDLITFNVSYLLGAGLALFAALSASLANMTAVKSSYRGEAILKTNFWWMSWTALITGTYALINGELRLPAWEFDYYAALLFLSLFGSVIAFTSFLALMERVGPSKASYIAVITPVLALAISTVYEQLTWHFSTYLGVGLIILGQLIIFNRPKKS